MTVNRWERKANGIEAPLIFAGLSVKCDTQVRKEDDTNILIYLNVDRDYIRPELCFRDSSKASPRYPACLQSNLLKWKEVLPARTSIHSRMNLFTQFDMLGQDPQKLAGKLGKEVANAVADRFTGELNQSVVIIRGWMKPTVIDPEEPQIPVVLDVSLIVRKGNKNPATYYFEVPYNDAWSFFEDCRESTLQEPRPAR